MKILVICPYPIKTNMPASFRSWTVLHNLIGLGHEVHLISPQQHPPEIEGLHHSGVPADSTSAGFFLNLLTTAIRTCRNGNYEALHLIDEALFLAPFLRNRKRKTVYDARRCFSKPGALRTANRINSIPLPAERFLLSHTDTVITSCARLNTELKGVAKKQPVCLIENTPPPGNPSLSPEKLRLKLGIQNVPVILCAGSDGSRKSLKLVMKAMRHILGQFPDARLIMACRFNDDHLKARDLASQVGIGNTCIFREEIPGVSWNDLLRIASAIILPYRTGRYPGAEVCACMHSGIPLVATKTKALTHLLNADNAILVHPHDDALAEGIRQALNEPLLSNALASQAATQAADHFQQISAFRTKLSGTYGG